MLIFEFTIRLLLALVLGAIIGFERQWRQKSAGLRTNTLVSVGAASFILLSESLTQNDGDPSRIAGQIVTGIGFLGAGVIMKTGMQIQGLNTAATIWCSAAVGTLSGAGLYWQALIASITITSVHLIFRPLGVKMMNAQYEKPSSDVYSNYTISIECSEQVENHIRVLILDNIRKEINLQLKSLRSRETHNLKRVKIDAELVGRGINDSQLEQIVSNLTMEYAVYAVSWGYKQDQEVEI